MPDVTRSTKLRFWGSAEDEACAITCCAPSGRDDASPLPAAVVRMAQALKVPYDDLNGKAFLIVPG
jgi:hypothetical protein